MRLLHCILRKKWSLILFYFLFIKFLSADVTFYLYKVTLYLYKADLHRIRHCVWAGRSSCCLDIWDKLQKWICRTIGPSLVATLDWNLTSLLKCSQLSLFYRCYFGMCSSKLAELVPLPVVILIECMIFLSFLNVIRMFMSTAYFHTESGFEILCLQSTFLWSMI